MGQINFLLNGAHVAVNNPAPTRTLLDWLREDKSLTGTKEGCNEGDCGACTVMVTSLKAGKAEHRAMNACILFLPQLDGKALRTVEGVSGPEDQLHPVQSRMITEHGSQCGFCTPGIIMSLVAAHRNKDKNHDDVLAGNLCRCTGYDPIVRAATRAARAGRQDWYDEDIEQLKAMRSHQPVSLADAYIPRTITDLAVWYLANPSATLVGGATDVGLWVTKGLSEVQPICFVGQIDEMKQIHMDETGMEIGAGASVTDLRNAIAAQHPDFGEMLRRYGSVQVRNAATIGGNIANGSPIGDGPPALIALGATITLQKGERLREMPIEDFFIAYGKQDREPSEFLVSIFIPFQSDNLKCYKLTKRFDQDISAVCGCFNITVEDEVVKSARIAFGGMAATPKRATAVEDALVGNVWDETTVKRAMAFFDKDYAPIGDMRASAEYRRETARNLLTRYYTETVLSTSFTRVLEVEP
jgi:xanthine dehydrogenase small subunit